MSLLVTSDSSSRADWGGGKGSGGGVGHPTFVLGGEGDDEGGGGCVGKGRVVETWEKSQKNKRTRVRQLNICGCRDRKRGSGCLEEERRPWMSQTYESIIQILTASTAHLYTLSAILVTVDHTLQRAVEHLDCHMHCLIGTSKLEVPTHDNQGAVPHTPKQKYFNDLVK